MKRRLYLPLIHCFPSTLLRAGIFALLITALVKPAIAVYDPTSVPNNRFGIHILFPEEINDAAKFVNSSGGDWGYVTIPIQSVDRSLDKWQKFLDDCKKLHVIPIIRIATYTIGPIWAKPGNFEAIDWTNFLDSLDWPTKNRYIIVYNEPNRAAEWGGTLNPGEYASVLADTYDALKIRNEDFYILNAGFDAAAPTNHELMDLYQYLTIMNKAYPGIFQKIDGWASHSYPNPGFSSHPYDYSRMGIRSYQHELSFLQDNFGVYGLKVFITETGWQKGKLSEKTISDYYLEAFNEIWTDEYLIAVSPFLLTAGGQFENFAWLLPGSEETDYYKAVTQIKKIKGEPNLSEIVKRDITKKSAKTFNEQFKKITNWPKLKINYWEKFFKWMFNY